LRDAVVVDLFAGSGALGLEALSRGAGRVYMVERSRRHIQALRENLRAVLKSAGPRCTCDVRILAVDVRRAPHVLAEAAGNVDVVFADPPYQPSAGEMGPAELLQDPDICAWAGHALLVLEHPTKAVLPWHPLTPWHLLRSQRFGSTTVSFAESGPDG
jgi:16S rRNA (guanine966-N2)-methyltransferase